MPRNGSGVYSAPAGTTAVANTTIESAKYNAFVADISADQNTVRPVVAGGTGASTQSGAQTALGLVIGTNVQAYDATLTSIAALGTAADKILYTTGADTWAEAAITTFGRSLIDDADAATARTTLGLGSAATATITNNDDLSVDPGNVGTRGNAKAYTDAAIAAIPTSPASNITAQNFTADSYGATIASSGEAYARCYYGGYVIAPNPGAAEFMIQASNDGGSTWGALVSLDRTTNGVSITLGDVFLINLSTGVCYGHKGMDLGVTNIDALRFRINYDTGTGTSDVDVALEYFD